MEYKEELRLARRKLTGTGATLLIYYMIMTELVTAVMLVDAIVYLVQHLIKNPSADYWYLFDRVMERIQQTATSNAWGYILAILVGTGILLLWKKPRYFKNELFRRNRPMTFGTFLQLLCVFMSVQLVCGLMQYVVEWILNMVGLSAMAALEMATVSTDTLSMFLYAGFLGPIAEELLFRGLLLRNLEGYGKRFAIFATALLFGMFHGNLIQSPFAMLVGLVLAYVALEYSIVWAIVLHIINNFVMADLFGRLLDILPEQLVPFVDWGVLGGFGVAALVILLVRRKDVKTFFAENKQSPIAVRAMMSSPTIWIFMGLMTVSVILTITRV